MTKVRIPLCLLIIATSVTISTGQISVPGDHFNRIDKKDTSVLTFYKSISNPDSDKIVKVLNPQIKLSYNNKFPRGYNDGPIWKGRGTTLEIHAGIQGRKGNFQYTFAPAFFYSENKDFALAPVINDVINPLGYQFSSRIDWVQRFGEGSFARLHLGQSELLFQKGKFLTAVSTQNYSIGPSVFNPIILSRQGEGFPHVRIGVEPFNIVIRKFDLGQFEGNYLMGLLRESDYNDNNPNNDNRYFNAIFLAYTPGFLPEVTIGFNKSLYKDTQFFENKDLISVVKILDGGVRGDTIRTNDTFDQLASLTMEWSFKEVGFRAYAEFAKNDFTGGGNPRWTLVEPEHSRAYTIGFEKVLEFKKDKSLTLNYEHTNLSRNHTHLWRAEPTFYLHHINRQGYTQNGQLLGAGIGPGGNSDHLSINYFVPGKKYGLLFQRIEANRDYFVDNIQGQSNHDIDYSASFFLEKETKAFDWLIEGTATYNFNRYYLDDIVNVYLGARARIKLDRL